MFYCFSICIFGEFGELNLDLLLPSVVHSHWSRNVEARLSLVERIIVLVRQLSYAIKDSWLPCTERSYYRRPYAIKNQRRASKTLVGGFGCPSWFFMA